MPRLPLERKDSFPVSNKLLTLKSQAKRDGWADWIRTEDDERALLAGCRFVQAKGERVVKFCADCLCHFQGEWAGKPFILADWQYNQVVMPLFSWIRADGTRRFRQISIWIAKKNGKSTLAAAAVIIGLVGDGEAGAEVYSAASTRKQAGIIFRAAQAMVESSYDLAKDIKVVPSEHRLVHVASRSFYQALSSEGASNEGWNSSTLVRDELHAWTGAPGRRLWDALEYSTINRTQPVAWDISTAGSDMTSIGWERYSYVKQVWEGGISNPALLPVIYEAPEDADPGTEAAWRSANPGLGETIKLDEIAASWDQASLTPQGETRFRRYRLNQWVVADSIYIRPSDWKHCKGDIDPETLVGKSCCGGLDLSISEDTTAWALAFPLADDIYAILVHFFLPEEGIETKQKRDGVTYMAWRDAGFFTLTPGKTINYDFIKQRIRDDAAKYNIEDIAYDIVKSDAMCRELVDEGYPMAKFSQTFVKMTEPTEVLRTMVREQKLVHFNNPVLNWQVGNAVVKEDSSANIKLFKLGSRGRIDGMVAAVMALGRARLIGDSPYDEDDGLFL